LWGLLTLGSAASQQPGPGIDGRSASEPSMDIDERLFDSGRNTISEGDKGRLDAEK
jgi:hypothetical protein